MEMTQEARLAALNGKKLLWVTCPVVPGMSAIMQNSAQFCLDHGIHLIGLFQSEEDKLYVVMKEKGLIHDAVFANLSDDENACANVVAALEESAKVVDAVFSPYEMSQVLVGEISDALQLPGNSATSYVVARSKHLAREATKAAGLATPRCGVAKDRKELDQVTRQVGFPCILKPSSGAGSCGVFRANTLEEALEAFDTIERDLKTEWTLSYSGGCDVSVLVEQLLLGDEFDVDMLLWEGEMVYAQPVLNWPCLAPYYLETGTQMPSPYAQDKLDRLVKYAFDCVKSMGFKQGCFHVEAMYTSEGPILIEVNPRQGGGPNQTFNKEMCGVDIFANFLLSSCGIPINPPRHEPQFAMADYAITCPWTGTLVDETFMDHIKAHPNVFSHQTMAKAGQKVKGIDKGFPQWVGQFIVKGDTPEHCEEIVNELIAGIEEKIHVVPEQETDQETTTTTTSSKTTAVKSVSPQTAALQGSATV